MLDHAIRIAAIAFLLATALQVLRTAGATLVGKTTALFMASVAAYMLCSSRTLFPQFGPVRPLIELGCTGVPLFFWWFSRSFFDDSFRIRPWHWGLLLVLEINGLWADIDLLRLPDLAHTASDVLHHVAGLGLVFWAMFEAMKDRENDLVESRRPIRWMIVVTAGAYVASVLSVELVFGASRAPAFVESLNAAGILALTIFLSAKLRRELVRELPLKAGADLPTDAARTTSEIDPADRLSLDALAHAMEQECRYRDEGLTIGGLAKRLGIQEYRLRRLINQHLGYRNFNAFLNHYRIAEAKQKLGDVNHARVPVLTLAMDLGYRSLSPFNRAFKEATGQTPTEFRTSQLAKSDANTGKNPVDSEKHASISESL